MNRMFLNSMKSFLIGLVVVMATDSSMAMQNNFGKDGCKDDNLNRTYVSIPGGLPREFVQKFENARDVVGNLSRNFLSDSTLSNLLGSASATVGNLVSDRLVYREQTLLSLRIVERAVSMISRYNILLLSKGEAHFLLKAMMDILCTINCAPTLLSQLPDDTVTALETIRDNLKPIVDGLNDLYHFHPNRSGTDTLSNNFEDHFRDLLNFVEEDRRIRALHDDSQKRSVKAFSGRQQNG